MANELISCDDDITVQGSYQDTDNTTYVITLNINGHDLQNLMQEANDNTQEPMVYHLSRNT